MIQENVLLFWKTIMELTYKKVWLEDIEILTKTKIVVLRTVNQRSDDVDICFKIWEWIWTSMSRNCSRK